MASGFTSLRIRAVSSSTYNTLIESLIQSYIPLLTKSKKMPTLGGLRVTIHTTDGDGCYSDPLTEYQEDSYYSPGTFTKKVYIITGGSSEFSIGFEALPEYEYTIGEYVRFRVWVDGQEVNGKFVDATSPTAMLSGAMSWDQGEAHLYPFQFSSVSLGRFFFLY